MLQSLKATARALVRQYRERYTTKDMQVTGGVLAGCTLRFQQRRMAQWQHEMLNGTFDTWIFQLLSRQRKTNVVWDIGSHIGYHALSFAAHLQNAGKVIAFEPNPLNVERINHNLRLNPHLAKQIEIREVALSNTDGVTQLRCGQDVDSGESSGSYIVDATPPQPVETYAGYLPTEIQCAKGDTLVAQGLLPPDFIKIDVEGAEALVLQGLSHTLQANRPLIALEIHNVQAMFDVLTLLRSVNYESEIVPSNEESASRCFLWAAPAETPEVLKSGSE